MSVPSASTHAFRTSDLPQNQTKTFQIRPDADALQALCKELGLGALRKLSFVGTLQGVGKRDWRLQAKLGATVVQPCVVTLDPVTTRIDMPVQRTYLSELPQIDAEEFEITQEDDETEALGAYIDPWFVMVEALALALPLYPRKEDADLGQAVFTEPGKTPMTDDDVKPFAGLAALKDKLK